MQSKEYTKGESYFALHFLQWGGNKMELLIVILKKIEKVPELVKVLAESGVKGGTILEGSGMAKELYKMEDLPFFGMLKMLLMEETDHNCKVLLFALQNQQTKDTMNLIESVIGDFKEPNTGIMFTVPITNVVGLKTKE